MVDEHLAQLLMLLGLPDPDIHLLSSRTALAEGARDGAVAHVCTERVETAGKDTDNAWTEAQLWAVELRYFRLRNRILLKMNFGRNATEKDFFILWPIF